ncbi:MAG: nucleotidyltransferase family protein [Rhodospirillaceae bacterium]|nr:nucleotidyltransferase family protein [Rhodospirillaceae bacterium]
MATTLDARSGAGSEAAILGTRIPALPDEIAEYCKRWSIMEMALFGSVLRDDFGPHSDIDVLVRFAPGPTPGLLGIVRMERELSELFGRRVDVVTRGSVENSRNPLRRRAILDSVQTVYAA